MKTLFIAPRFYSYHKFIIRELSKYSDVFFYSEVPYGSKIFFFIKNFFPSKIESLRKRYAEKLFMLVKEKSIEQLFIIRGYGIDTYLLEKVKLYNPKIAIINCQWDTIANNPNGSYIGRWADKNYTFDMVDAQTYHWNYLPLFYYWDNNRKYPFIYKDIDILFVGSYHSNRHLIVKELQKLCEVHGKRIKSHLYLPFYSFLRKFLFTHEVSFCDVKFWTLNRKKYFELLQRSRAVLDIQYKNQNGLTIRTIEALSVGTKIITTNLNIKNSKCYNQNNVYILREFSDRGLIPFLEKTFDNSQKGLIDLNTWLKMMSVI